MDTAAILEAAGAAVNASLAAESAAANASITADAIFDSEPGPQASASTGGDVAAEVNRGSEWFSLLHTSVGISFGAVAAFLIMLFIVWACFQSRLCGLFNCCLLCQPSARRAPAPAQPAWPPGVLPRHYVPGLQDHPSSATPVSSIYGYTFGASTDPTWPPSRASHAIEMDPPTRSDRSRHRSTSSVSRVFLNARRDAARYVSRFSEAPNDHGRIE